MIDERFDRFYAINPNAQVVIPSFQMAPGMGYAIVAANRLAASNRAGPSGGLPTILERNTNMHRQKNTEPTKKEGKEKRVSFSDDVVVVHEKKALPSKNPGRYLGSLKVYQNVNRKTF